MGRASQWGHPAVTALAPGVFGLIAGCVLAGLFGHLDREVTRLGQHGAGVMPWFWRIAGRPWTALAMGALLGIPASLFEARHLGRHFDQFVALQRLSLKERKAPQWRQLGLSAWAPTVLAMTVATALGAVLGLSMVVAPLGALIPIPLTYPVERRIHRAARPTSQSE